MEVKEMAIKLNATLREDHKSSTTRKLRNEGQVPGVIYGKDKETKSIAVNSIELVKTVRDEGRNAIISLDIENNELVDVMLHDYQMDVLKDELVHVDFFIVDMSDEMDVGVGIRLDGDAPGTKEGGILQKPLFELVVGARSNNIPDVITVADLPKSDNYEILEEDDTTVATVTAPTEEDLEPSTEDESAEPELVGAEEEEEEE